MSSPCMFHYTAKSVLAYDAKVQWFVKSANHARLTVGPEPQERCPAARKGTHLPKPTDLRSALGGN